MRKFDVQLTKPALADLDKVSHTHHSVLIRGLESLAGDPLPSGKGKKRLKGFKFPLYRLRAGDFRVLYRIDRDVVTIMRIIDRKDLEKAIKRLKKV